MLKQHDDTPHPHEGLTCPLMTVNGATAGPRLVVLGSHNLLESLAHQLWDLHMISIIRGSLILRTIGQSPVFDRPDHVMFLACKAQHAYSLVINRMFELGMVSDPQVHAQQVA
jgi:hypothetical protein